MVTADPSNPLTLGEQRFAITTWRYLRLSIVALLLGLVVAVGFERWKVRPGCFQESISAYYYTPAQGVLVGVLVAVGACLVCIQSNNDIENALLNLAGILAPAVALVPTPNMGSCTSVPGSTLHRNENVANNGFALLVVGGIAIVLSTIVVVVARSAAEQPPSVTTWIGHGAAVAVWGASVVVFTWFRSVFVGNAHYAAATSLGICIAAVVLTNASDVGNGKPDSVRGVAKLRPRNWNVYSVIAAAIIVAIVVTVILNLSGWDYWLLFIELAIASLFAIFWAVQTAELWHDGLR